MKPTEILSSEHRVIEGVLGALEALATESEKARALDRETARKAILFLKVFADKCHHGKEEGQLFKKLVEKGMPHDIGPVGVMLSEHERGRALIRRMDAAQEAWREGVPEPLAEFVAAAREYTRLLRGHILKEDNILFPMAAGMLSEAEQSAMSDAFHKIEHEDMPAGAHEDMVAIARDLMKRFDVKPVPASQAPTCGCHCG